jgi:threonine/homoserine/homoserine lactone efflux protein
MLFEISTLLTFVLAALALIVSPGPGQALVIARTLSGGLRAGVMTAAGLQIGTLGHTVAAALGLSALLAASATAYSVVKYVGAAYLVVLGVLTLMKTRGKPQQAPAVPADVSGRLVLHAAITGLLNPKVAVFFVAFLPQFVHPERGQVLLQFVCLGVLLATLGVIGDSLVAWITHRASHRLVQGSRLALWRERITGTVLIGLGLRLALPDRR